MMISRILWSGIAIAGTVFAFSGCAPTAEPDRAQAPRPVKTFTVGLSQARRDVNLPAIIEAGQSAELTFQIAGTITELNVLEGQRVSEGTTLVALDQRDARNRLAQSLAEYENAEAEYVRAERLAEADAISRSVLETRKSQRDVSRASLDSARKALDDTVLKAPFDGIVSRVFVREFQNVQSKEPILNIQNGELEAVINVPSGVVAQAPSFSSQGAQIRLDSLPDLVLPGTLKEVSGEADSTTSTFRVSLAFEAPEQVLVLPGMTATVFASLSTEADAALMVPLSAVITRTEQPHVWRIRPNANTVEAAPLTIGRSMGNGFVEVLSGLEAGDEIVSAGAAFLSDGQSVTRWTPE